METRRLLVGVDGSVASLEAARTAIDLAGRWHSELRVVYVIETAEPGGSTDGDLTKRLRESGYAILDRVARIAEAQGVIATKGLLEGVPFDAILAEARSWKADLIVMGRTGRTGPGRALLGSEAERLLEFTERPVLIVPTTSGANDSGTHLTGRR